MTNRKLKDANQEFDWVPLGTWSDPDAKVVAQLMALNTEQVQSHIPLFPKLDWEFLNSSKHSKNWSMLYKEKNSNAMRVIQIVLNILLYSRIGKKTWQVKKNLQDNNITWQSEKQWKLWACILSVKNCSRISKRLNKVLLTPSLGTNTRGAGGHRSRRSRSIKVAKVDWVRQVCAREK
jgi:hypothetical protein